MFRRLLPVVIFSAVLLGIVSLNFTSADGPARAAKSSPGAKAKPKKPKKPKKAKQETRKTPASVELSQAKAPSEADLRKALETTVPVDFEEVPLNELMQRFAKATGANFWLDVPALVEEGVSLDTPITLKEKPIAVARVLDRILEPLGLTWIIQDHIIQITTLVAADEILVTVTYPVGDLLEYAKTHSVQMDDMTIPGMGVGIYMNRGLWMGMTGEAWNSNRSTPADWLVYFLYNMTDGPWQSTDGTGGTIIFLNNNLVVRQTRQNQVEVAKILGTIRQCIQGQLKSSPVAIRPPHYAVEEDEAVKRALAKVISVKCDDMALDAVIADIGNRLDVQVHINEPALRGEGVAMDENMNLELKNLPADSLLHLALKPLGLTSIVEDGRLLVTTLVAADERFFTKIYDIRDLSAAGSTGKKLLQVMLMETDGPWQNTDGAGGTMFEPLNGLLGVRHIHKVHQEVAAILADLRKQIADSPNQQEETEVPDPQAVSTKFYRFDTTNDSLAIQHAILTLIKPKSWSKNGGEGEIVLIKNRLVVKTRNEIQTEVQTFLKDLGHDGARFTGMGMFRVPPGKPAIPAQQNER